MTDSRRIRAVMHSAVHADARRWTDGRHQAGGRTAQGYGCSTVERSPRIISITPLDVLTTALVAVLAVGIIFIGGIL